MATNASAKARRPAQNSASVKEKTSPATAKPAAAAAAAPPPSAPAPGGSSSGTGITPIYITEQALVRWQMKTGADITDVVPFKYLKKADIVKELIDTGFMCDFYDIRDAVKAYPGEDLLLIYDPTSQYGQNYYWCSSLDRVATEEQRLRDKAEGKAEEQEEAKAPEEQEVLVERPPEDFEDKPMVARPWESLGSEEEVYQLTVKNSRRPLGFTITRKRREFGKRVDLTDVDPPDKIDEFRRQKVPGYELEKAVLELGFQIAPAMNDGATQTACYRLLNKGIQSEPIQMVEAEKQRLLDSPDMKLFVSSVSRLCEEALLQNETVDLFKNEFAVFQDEEVNTANRNENTLKGIHTFTHLTFSKGRKICAINWHPSKVGVVAFGCSSNLSFDDWVEMSGQVASSTILIWNFSNVLQPEYILQVPGNLTCFSISPHNPLLIAGGLSTGQVVYWNLAEVKTKANRARTEEAQTSATDGSAASSGGAQEKAQETQYATIQPTMISYVDKSHSRHVTDIKWLPKGMKVKKNGEIRLQEAEWGSMFVSSSTDGMLLFWDLLSPQEDRQRELERSNASGAAGSPSPIPGGEASEGEVKWTYVYSVPIKRLDSQSLLSVFRLSVNGTRIACVTEDGEVAFGDWSLASSFSAFGANAFNLSNNSLGANASAGAAPPAGEKEKKENAAAAAVAAASSDGPKQIISKLHKGHVHAGMAIHRSPHFPDLYLSIGDYSFSIWREDLDYPIFSSPYASDLLTCGCWSPTRPAVIFVAKRDGSVDVWELLDQCHRETMSYSASQSAISGLECWQSKLSSQQLLAVGDSEGNLHVLEVPKPLRRKLAKEEKLMRDFYDREVHRVEFAAKRAVALKESSKGAGDVESDAKPTESAEAVRAATPIDKAEEEFQKVLAKYRSELAD